MVSYCSLFDENPNFVVGLSMVGYVCASSGHVAENFPRPWLAFSPWIRKPNAFANSSPTINMKSESNAEHKTDGNDSDSSSSKSGDDSDNTDAEDEASSRFDTDDKETADNRVVSSAADNSAMSATVKIVTSNLSSPISNKGTIKSFSHVNNKAKPEKHKERPAPLSTEQLDVLKLEKEKLTIEIEVLHLKKKKLILQLEHMAHSSAPFVP